MQEKNNMDSTHKRVDKTNEVAKTLQYYAGRALRTKSYDDIGSVISEWDYITRELAQELFDHHYEVANAKRWMNTFNSHPINVLYAARAAELTGDFNFSADSQRDAIKFCKRMVKDHSFCIQQIIRYQDDDREPNLPFDHDWSVGRIDHDDQSNNLTEKLDEEASDWDKVMNQTGQKSDWEQLRGEIKDLGEEKSR
jgi:hypothetical protein